MNRIYCSVGKIIELTQHIELSVLDLCELSEIVKEFSRHKVMTSADFAQAKDDAAYLKKKMQTMTFGQLVVIINESKSMAYDEVKELKSLLEKRNYFAHEYFKYTDFGIVPDGNFILEEFTALKEYLGELKKMTSRIEVIKQGLKNKLEYLISKNNL